MTDPDDTPESGAPVAVGTYHAHAELRNRNWEAEKQAEDAEAETDDGGEE